MTTAIEIKNLTHQFKARRAVDNLTLSIAQGEIFCVLGPNGSGKTTLFRILSTLFRPTSGSVLFWGLDLDRDFREIRKKIGVVFQNPALDLKLTVRENLIHQGHLYGLQGRALDARAGQMLTRLGLLDRAGDLAGTLSGGLKRRVELAKGLLHKPALVLLDEPSTGLDPGARAELWNYLLQLKREEGVTVLVTTHFMDEAERCDRLVIMAEGKILALDSPQNLLRTVGSDFIEVITPDAVSLSKAIFVKFKTRAVVTAKGLRLEHPGGPAFAAELLAAFPAEIQQVVFRKATLEDVFLAKTGHPFWEEKTA